MSTLIEELERMAALLKASRREAYKAGYVRGALAIADGQLDGVQDVDELIAAAEEACSEDLFAGPEA